MQRDIATILKKIQNLNVSPQPHAIEIDLMLQETRQLYSILLELQGAPRTVTETTPQPETQIQHVEVRFEPVAVIPDKPAINETTVEPEIQQEIKQVESVGMPAYIPTEEPTLEDIIAEAEHIVDTEPATTGHDMFTEQLLQTETASDAVTAAQVSATQVIAEKDIRRSIGINDKYQYISELFGNNKDAYEAALTRLNSFENYPDAVTWMDEVHTENRWDDEHPTVISFYDMLSQFFSSK